MDKNAELIEELAFYVSRHPAEHVALIHRIHTLTGGKLSLAELDELTRQVETRLKGYER